MFLGQLDRFIACDSLADQVEVLARSEWTSLTGDRCTKCTLAITVAHVRHASAGELGRHRW